MYKYVTSGPCAMLNGVLLFTSEQVSLLSVHKLLNTISTFTEKSLFKRFEIKIQKKKKKISSRYLIDSAYWP